MTLAHTLNRERSRQYFLLLVIPFVSLGLTLTLALNPANTLPTVYANNTPYNGETCFATFDNGTTVFSSTTASALQQAVDTTSPGMMVKVAGTCPGVTARSGVTQTVYVSQSLTIQGGYSPNDWSQSYPITQPTTLDAMSGGRVLYVTGDITVTLDGLHITGGNAHGLGGLGSTDAGGGLYITATSVIVQQSTFITNTGGDGSDSTDYNVPGGDGGMGGAIYNGGSLTLTDSTLTGNTAGNGGSNNMQGMAGTGGWGGAIYNTNMLSIIRSLINSNYAGVGGNGGTFHTQFLGGNGGGIFSASSLSVISSTISGNGAGNYGDGGGISNQGIMTATHSIFSNNNAGDGSNYYHVGGPGGRGGGIFNNGTLTVQASTLTNNSAGSGASNLLYGGNGGDGGGIYSVGSLTVSNSTFTNNSSGSAGLADLYAIYAHEGNGGGIYSLGSLIVSDSAFRHNIAPTHGTITETLGSQGGAIAALGTSAALSNNQVTANSANYGGGLYLSANAVLTNTVIADNQAVSYGSGVVLAGSISQLWHSTIARNSGGDGAGVYISGTAILTNSIIVSQTVGITTTLGSTGYVNRVLWYDISNSNTNGSGNVVISNPYTGSPAFVNPNTGDYHLTAASAAINRGIRAGVKFDLDGKPRDLAPDLGAYEYQFPWQLYLPWVMKSSSY